MIYKHYDTDLVKYSSLVLWQYMNYKSEHRIACRFLLRQYMNYKCKETDIRK